MAATIQVREFNAGSNGSPSPAGGTDKSATAIRFKHADDSTVDLNNPMVKPGAGSNWSRKKSISLYCSAKNTSTQISNIKAYWDGTFGAGTGLTVYTRATPTTYTVASADQDGTGEGSTWVDFASYNSSGAAQTIHAAAATLTDATRVPMSYLELYLKVGTTVTAPVTVPAESFTFTWDEV